MHFMELQLRTSAFRGVSNLTLRALGGCDVPDDPQDPPLAGTTVGSEGKHNVLLLTFNSMFIYPFTRVGCAPGRMVVLSALCAPEKTEVLKYP